MNPQLQIELNHVTKYYKHLGVVFFPTSITRLEKLPQEVIELRRKAAFPT